MKSRMLTVIRRMLTMTKKKIDQRRHVVYEELTDKNKALAYAIVGNPDIAPYKLYRKYYKNCTTDESAQSGISRLRANEDFARYLAIAESSTIMLEPGLNKDIIMEVMSDPAGNYAISLRTYLLQQALSLVPAGTKVPETVKMKSNGEDVLEEVERYVTTTERLKATKMAYDMITPQSLDLNVHNEAVTIIRTDERPEIAVPLDSTDWEKAVDEDVELPFDMDDLPEGEGDYERDENGNWVLVQDEDADDGVRF
ncbi:gp1 [Listeria phage P40]|uniref:gp1 n=1 Tax=Listeria phage P40 TaxID=560178 RepID=UPI00018198B8|nr:gp1 [Listeria phage P40]ACI00361.1 gp1 [Listeria phage P40]